MSAFAGCASIPVSLSAHGETASVLDRRAGTTASRGFSWTDVREPVNCLAVWPGLGLVVVDAETGRQIWVFSSWAAGVALTLALRGSVRRVAGLFGFAVRSFAIGKHQSWKSRSPVPRRTLNGASARRGSSCARRGRWDGSSTVPRISTPSSTIRR
jgi:hypothetical protein